MKTIEVEIEPGGSRGRGGKRRLVSEPGEKRAEFLDLDDVELLVSVAVLGKSEEDGTICRRR